MAIYQGTPGTKRRAWRAGGPGMRQPLALTKWVQVGRDFQGIDCRNFPYWALTGCVGPGQNTRGSRSYSPR